MPKAERPYGVMYVLSSWGTPSGELVARGVSLEVEVSPEGGVAWQEGQPCGRVSSDGEVCLAGGGGGPAWHNIVT